MTAIDPPLNLFERITQSIATGDLDDPNRNPIKKTIQPIRGSDERAVAQQVADIRQLVNTMAGNINASSLLDASITVRDMIQSGLLTLDAGNIRYGKGTGLILSPEGVPSFGGGISGSTLTEIITTITGFPILTAAPTPENLRASGTYAHVILTWELPIYQNHGYTEVWRASTNNLALAVLIGTAVGQIYVDESNIELGVLHYYWVREVTNDPIPLVSPFNAGTGGGTSGGAGYIEGESLGPLIIEARHLAASNPGVLSDPTFESGAVGWPFNGSGGLVQRLPSTDAAVPAGCPFPYAAQFIGRDCWGVTRTVVWPGEQYRFSIYVNRAGLGPRAAGLIVFCKNTADVTVGGGVLATTSATPSATWEHTQEMMTVPAGTAYMIIGPWIDQPHVTGQPVWFTGLLVEKAIDASLVTANMIAVGTAAIENGAINNAMIGNAAIDTAQIVNLAVNNAKIADLAITNGKIVNATILGAKIGVAQIGSAHIIDGNITEAKIGNASINNAAIKDIIQSASYLPGVSGWKLDKAGQLEANTATFRGNLSAATGTFAGSLLAATGTFTGSLTAATGTFAGSLTAATGTFAGSLNAATGTFDGTLTAGALTVAGNSMYAPAYAEADNIIGPTSGHDWVSGTSGWERVNLQTTSINPGATGSVTVVVTIDWLGTGASDGGSGGG